MKCCKYIVLLILSVMQMATVLGQVPPDGLAIEKSSNSEETNLRNDVLKKTPFESIVVPTEVPTEVMTMLPNKVRPLEDTKIENGEIYTMIVETVLSNEDLLKLKNKKINEIMYVMSIDFNGGELGNEKTFLVFITDPPQQTKKNQKKPTFDTYFNYSDFEYSPSQKKMAQDFLQIDIPFDLDGESTNYVALASWTFGVILILALVAFGSRKLWLRRKGSLYKKLNREKANALVQLINAAKSRDDFEEIYRKRKSILHYTDVDPDLFQKLLTEINRFQYRLNWEDEYSKAISDQLNNLGTYKVKRGV